MSLPLLSPSLSISFFLAMISRWSYVSVSPTQLQQFISSRTTQRKKRKTRGVIKDGETEREREAERASETRGGHGRSEKQSLMPLINVYTPRQMEMMVLAAQQPPCLRV